MIPRHIYGFDLDGNPKTNSWMGLSKDTAKIVANIFIWIGLWLTISILFPDPSDLLIFWASGWLQTTFGLSIELSYILWHTVIAWFILLVGIWIYPHSTYSMFNGYINKAKKGLSNLMKNPIKLAIGLLLAYLLFIWMKNNFRMV